MKRSAVAPFVFAVFAASACGITIDAPATTAADGGMDGSVDAARDATTDSAVDSGGETGTSDSGAETGATDGGILDDSGPIDAGSAPILIDVYGIANKVDVAPSANSLIDVTSIDTDTKVLTVGGGNVANGAFVDVQLTNNAGDAVAMRVKRWTVNQAVRITGSKPLVVVADTIDIQAKIDASARGVTGGPGVSWAPGVGGNGTSKSGGGGGGRLTNGATGGGASYAENNNGGSGGTSSPAYPFALLAGSAGGASGNPGGGCGRAGGAGGALLLHATTSLTVGNNGLITVHVGGGEGGCPFPLTLGGSGGGGGGSGGTVLLTTGTLTITGKLLAFGGGGGGAGASNAVGVRGGDGKDPPDDGQNAVGGAGGDGLIVGGIGFNGGSGGSGGGTAGPQAGQRDGSGGGGGGAAGRLYLRATVNNATTLKNLCSPTCEVL